MVNIYTFCDKTLVGRLENLSAKFLCENLYKLLVDNNLLEDQILLKSDGYPTYNFANVIDDHLMEITHVVRGNEYLSSTPKYLLLYEAFGWESPEYIHLPHIVKEGGKKISKRDGDSTFMDLYNMGYLPEAIINYLALLGWSPEDNQEIYTMDELIEKFSISGLSKSSAIFDEAKMKWLNGEYIKELSFDKFMEYPDDDIICITVASKLSGTYQSAVIAKTETGRENIYVVDSTSVSLGAGILVETAVEMIKKGHNAVEIAEKLSEIAPKIELYAAVDTLKYLVKGGRLGKASGAVGSLLGIKPILRVDTGKLDTYKKCRGMKKVKKEILILTVYLTI